MRLEQVVEMQSLEYWMGSLFFVVMFVVLTLTLLNIFIGLTGEVYSDCHQESQGVWEDLVNELMEQSLINGGLAEVKKTLECVHH